MTEDVAIGAGRMTLPGSYTPPTGGRGLIVFAHGSGSGRLSPRNAAVAGPLHDRGFGTLLFDLLAEDESLDRRNVFDIDLLADRLVAAVEWAVGRASSIGLFGASTGAAAALVAASRLPGIVRAVVSRGGRPDLAAGVLADVAAPTLLIVGDRDVDVLALNRDAERRITAAETRLDLVPGATHLFEEPGALERVADLAAEWFERHLAGQGA